MIPRVGRVSAAVCFSLALMFGVAKQSLAAAAAVLGGGLLTGFSWWAIAGAVDALLVRSRGETAQKPARLPLVKFFTRHAIVALAAYGMMVRLRLDPIGLLAGVSSLGIALVVEAFRHVRWRRFQ